MNKHQKQKQFKFGLLATLIFNSLLWTICHFVFKNLTYLIGEGVLKKLIIPQLVGFGLIQYLYIVPVLIFTFAMELDEVTKGIMVASLITIAINAILFLIIVVYFWNFSFLGF